MAWAIWMAAGAAALLGAAAGLRLTDARADARATARLLATAAPPRGTFDPATLATEPEAVRRYLARAIAPGTPLARSVHLEMEGEFLLNGRALPMRATQVLVPPEGFVWQARIGRGVRGMSGSDALIAGQSWTRFRLAGLMPLVRAGGNPDHARSAGTRALMEAVWCPTALLPGSGASWRQTGPDEIEVGFPTYPDLAPMRLALHPDGLIREVTALRWSNANPDRKYRLQPFGGRVLESRRFGGLTIPSRLDLGNNWGTPEYDGFFRAEVTSARI